MAFGGQYILDRRGQPALRHTQLNTLPCKQIPVLDRSAPSASPTTAELVKCDFDETLGNTRTRSRSRSID